MEDNFKLWKKWFWVGVIVGFLNFIAGLIFSIALLTEPNHKKEGLILLGWTVLSFVFLVFVVVPRLQ